MSVSVAVTSSLHDSTRFRQTYHWCDSSDTTSGMSGMDDSGHLLVVDLPLVGNILLILMVNLNIYIYIWFNDNNILVGG